MAKLSKRLKKIRHFMEYAAALTALSLVRLVPRRLAMAGAGIAGLVMFHIPQFRGLAVASVRAAFPDKSPDEARRIAKASFRNLARSITAFLWFVGRTERLRPHTVIPEHVDRLIRDYTAGGRGFVSVTPHLGCWEIAGLIIGEFLEVKFAVVAREMRNPYLSRLVNSGRMTSGNQVISSRGATRNCLKAIQEGRTVITLIDQNTKIRDGGVFVNFFGLPVPSSRAPAMMARRLDVPLFVGGCIVVDGKYQLFAEAMSKAPADYADEAELVQELMAITEKFVRQYPEQYLWFYKRFLHIPLEAGESLAAKYPSYAERMPAHFYRRGAVPTPANPPES